MNDAAISGKQKKRDRSGESPRLSVTLSHDRLKAITKAATKAGMSAPQWAAEILSGYPHSALPRSFAFPQIASALGQLKAMRKEMDHRWLNLLESGVINQIQLASWMQSIEVKLTNIHSALTTPLEHQNGSGVKNEQL
jgi:hypothetical protein